MPCLDQEGTLQRVYSIVEGPADADTLEGGGQGYRIFTYERKFKTEEKLGELMRRKTGRFYWLVGGAYRSLVTGRYRVCYVCVM